MALNREILKHKANRAGLAATTIYFTLKRCHRTGKKKVSDLSFPTSLNCPRFTEEFSKSLCLKINEERKEGRLDGCRERGYKEGRQEAESTT